MRRRRLRRSSTNEDQHVSEKAVDRMEQASQKLEKRWKLPDDSD